MEKINDNCVYKSPEIECVSNELINLRGNVSDLSEYFKEAFQRIRSDAEDVKWKMETGDTFKIGRESVQPLVELKNVATEVFANVRNSEVKLFHQELDVKPFWTHIDELKKAKSETREIINLFDSLKDAAAKLIEQQKNQKANINKDESCTSSASSVSISSDPSALEFSLFNNSSVNAATSSPIQKRSE